ncbi:MAG: hypothetical protein J7L82_04500 [Staphylothermus sp.]|nr:hypothetical protein [Staphylothermus sp.]
MNNPRILIILFIIFGLFATIGGIMLTYVCNTLMTDLDYSLRLAGLVLGILITFIGSHILIVAVNALRRIRAMGK